MEKIFKFFFKQVAEERGFYFDDSGEHDNDADVLALMEAVDRYSKNQVQQAKEPILKALKTTLEALLDLSRQIPNDERLVDYRLDFAEYAEAFAKQVLVDNSISSYGLDTKQ